MINNQTENHMKQPSEKQTNSSPHHRPKQLPSSTVHSPNMEYPTTRSARSTPLSTPPKNSSLTSSSPSIIGNPSLTVTRHGYRPSRSRSGTSLAGLSRSSRTSFSTRSSWRSTGASVWWGWRCSRSDTSRRALSVDGPEENTPSRASKEVSRCAWLVVLRRGQLLLSCGWLMVPAPIEDLARLY